MSIDFKTSMAGYFRVHGHGYYMFVPGPPDWHGTGWLISSPIIKKSKSSLSVKLHSGGGLKIYITFKDFNEP